MKKHLLSFYFIFSISIGLFAQTWEELSINSLASQVLSYNNNLYVFYTDAGVGKLTTSTDNGNTFGNTLDLATGVPTSGWKLSPNGILYTTQIDISNILFQKIHIIDLNQSTLSVATYERSDYDPNSTLTTFSPSSKTHAPNGDIWLGNLKSEDDGASWIHTDLIFPPMEIDPNGKWHRYQSFGDMLETADTGKTWTYITQDGPWKNLNSIHYASASKIICFSSDFPGMSNDGGVTWDTLGQELGIGNWKGIYTSSNDMYVYKDYDQIYRLKDGETKWDTTTDFSFKLTTSMCEHSNGNIYATIGGTLMEYAAGSGGGGNPTSVETKSENNEFSFFPNPAKNFITINYSGLYNSWINITDVLGKTVFKQRLNANYPTISVTNLPRGLYFVEIDGNIKKLIIE